MATKRIGILTSGGDCPGLNAVIRGAVKASHQLGYDCVGFLRGYEGMYDPVQYMHLTPDTTRGILSQGGTILGSTNKGRFAATVGVNDRLEIAPELMTGVKQTVDQLGLDGLICVGGDGSLAIAQQFHEQGIPVVGVPKTIDNDLSATAFTFGFDSAIECATDALDRLHTTAASHERIMVLEVMGRHAGWIALHAGIAGGGDVILIPEIPWSFEHVCHKILRRESQGKKFTLVVVAEGAELPGGELVGENRAGGQMKLGGLGRAVAEEIERRTHRETRLSVLGHLQRGGKPTTFDRVLATQFGAHAVRLVKEGRFGEMICSRPPEMTSVPIIEAINVLRRVDPHGPCVQAARALGVSFGDRPADEIGQDIFDRLEPVSHVAGYDEAGDTAETDTQCSVELPAEAKQAAAVAEPVEATSEVVAVTPEAEASPSIVDTTPIAARDSDTEAPVADLDVAPATEETSEETAAEQVAETVLDLAAELDEAAHGPVETPAESEAADPPAEPEMPETDESPLETPPAVSPALELEPEALPPEADEAEAAEDRRREPPSVDLAAAQAALAQNIARAAKASRDEAVKSELEVNDRSLDVAELVKQKLAAAKPAPPDEAKGSADAAEDEAKPAAGDGDRLAAARAALEQALAD